MTSDFADRILLDGGIDIYIHTYKYVRGRIPSSQGWLNSNIVVRPILLHWDHKVHVLVSE